MKTLTYGTLPSRAEFETAFYRQGLVGNLFPFSNDPRVGTCELTCSELWGELVKAHYNWMHCELGRHRERAGRWCSDVLGILGFEWV